MAKTDLTPVYAAANEASRAYNKSMRRAHILRAYPHLRNRNLSRRLVEFYLDDIDREIDHILGGNNVS